MSWLRRQLAPPTCPCGQGYVEWTDDYVDGGYRFERRWYGCPRLRDGESMKLHGGRWRRSKVVAA